MVWVAIQIGLARPAQIATDWNGWRQADTQTIARNFARDAIDPLHPRIAWGGNGSGLVESEVQVYPALIALALRRTGDVEWPGQVISTLAWAAAAIGLVFALAPRFGPVPAGLGGLLFLASPLAIRLSSAVMPEAMMLACYVWSLAAFLRYLDNGRSGWLWGSAVLLALAAAMKPTALNLGIVEFVLVAVSARSRLRSPQLWASWLAVLIATGLELWIGHLNYLASGNSFGVISSGTDLKFPGVAELLDAHILVSAAKHSLVWSVTWVGAAALLWILLRDRLRAEEIALGVGAVAALLISLRYSSGQAHYHVFSTVPAAWFLAHALGTWRSRQAGSKLSGGVAIAVAAILVALFGAELGARIQVPASPQVQNLASLAHRLGEIARPGDLIVVRSLGQGFDQKWQRRNNYEDPRAFYVADLTGWALPSDRPSLEELKGYVQQGAKYYLEAAPLFNDPALSQWLSQTGAPVVSDATGIIIRFDPKPAP